MSGRAKQADPEDTGAQRFGTFGGVFTPCTLTILGVIMFLRFGQVVGQCGVWHGLLVVAMAKVITTLTALSLSAICTNTRVKGGGAYYLISRSLGVEFGGAIGVVFYLSQAISVAMYIMGFTETLVALVPALAPSTLLVASGVNVVVFICVYVGAGWAIKVQYVILGVLALAIVAFTVGALRLMDAELLRANLAAGYVEGASLWTMFALFFPAATGIMAGANLSGDLRDPGKSIPRGTLLSIGTTALVYMVFVLLLAGSAPREALIGNNMIVSALSASPALIMAGIFAATLSSALGSMMGAPRILQALARDRIFPVLSPFAKGSGASSEPRRATVLSFLVAQAGVLIGDLNVIAPIITMFFMITYGALNFATFAESFSRNPSYRPTFRWCHWTLSLTGALLCVGIMVLIDAIWAVVAVAAMAAIYMYLKRQELESSWGDVSSGAALERVRRTLLTLEQERYHPKNWRPMILAMGGMRDERLYLAVQARWLAGRSGLLMFGQVIVGDADSYLERHAGTHKTLRTRIADQRLEAFPVLTAAPSLEEGLAALVQCAGVGALRPNLVMLGWNRDVSLRAQFLANLQTVTRLGRSLALLRCDPPPEAADAWRVPDGPIDVWWRGYDNGPLMLLLAHQVRTALAWQGRPIRLLRMMKSEAGQDEAVSHLEQLACEARITATARAVTGAAFGEVLLRESGDSALVVMGLADPATLGEDDLERVDAFACGLTRVLFVHSAGDMSLQV